MDEKEPAKKSGYDKRPLWQWILLYVVVAGILYYGVYYFFLRSKTVTGPDGTTTTQSQSLY